MLGGQALISSLRTIALFIISGLFASALGGAIGTFLLLIGGNGIDRAIPAAVLSAFTGTVLGISFAGIPTTFAGGLLWLAVNARRQLDRILTWLVAGTMVGLAVAAIYGPTEIRPLAGDDPFGGLGPPGVAVCFAFAGANAALMFRQTMRALTGFLPPSDRS